MSAERLTVPALVRRRAAEQPEKPFVVTDDDVLTYGELDRETAVVASRFAAAGVGKGTRVGVLMPNGTAWPVVALGVARAGGTVVPLSTLLRPPELAAQLHTAAVEHLVMVPTFRGRDYLADLAVISPELVPGTGRFVDALPRLRSITEWDADRRVPTDDDVDRAPVDARDAAIRPADDLVIVFTSGSRGRPKGVIHTHGGALGATEAGLEVRRLGRDDRLYIPMPFFWVGGFGTGLLSALLAGATLLTDARPEPARTLPFLDRNRVTLFRGWPDQAAALARDPGFAAADLSSLRAGSLDAVLPADMRAGPGQRAGLLGMTESFGPYSGYRLDQTLPPGKEGSCGRVFDGVEVRVVDLLTGGPVADGETGELQLRGPNLMRGICGRTRAEVFTDDGFYATGDVGHLDADGFLFLTGRRDDRFKVRGATVYPSEVEGALHALPSVRRAFVVDVVGEGGGAEVAAVVVPADDVS
ncbi:MAG TPA: class I adenylate-forming enzyme family protein, partial [Acidimicrobiia bacterium]|nr:class I adenylate-forming enzyme family protein [Acidimicrobiia bacterium]